MTNVGFLLFGFILISCGCVGCKGVVRLTPNVALTGIATQSTTFGSTFFAFLANDAIDGNIDICTLTKNTPPVWWQVDLQKVYEITKVAVTAWGNTELKDFYIDVSNNSDGSSAQRCAYEPRKFNDGETRVYSCPCELFGRYVRVRLPVNRSTGLGLCEVQVQPGGHCPEPEEMDKAMRTVPHTRYEVGTNITYTCDPCYTGGGTSTCQCNRDWSLVPKCRDAFPHCNHPGSIENGQVKGRSPFNCISSVTYNCKEGYWMLGSEKLKCGTDGHWDHVKPVCIEKNLGCGEPPKMRNAQWFGSLTNITYHCDDGYTGGGRSTCRNGQWNHDGSCSKDAASKDMENNNKIKGDAALKDQENNDKEMEKCNDGVILGLTAVGSMLGGILIMLVAVLLCKRKGIDPCARFEPHQPFKEDERRL